MKAQVIVRLKDSVLDPQGEAVQSALVGLGYDAVRAVRIGKWIELDLDVDDAEKAADLAQDAAKDLLANLVIERFDVEVERA